MNDAHDRVGKVQTVRGLISPEQLGRTLIHEHVLPDNASLFDVAAADDPRADAPITLENLSWVKRNLVKNRANLDLTDVDTAIEAVQEFRHAGGGTIVDVTPKGKRPNPLGVRRVSAESGLNIVMGCGWYRAPTHPPGLDELTEDDVLDRLVRDVTVGLEDTDVRAGIIGEIGCSVPLHDNERKVLRAAARAQALTGAPLSIHPPFEDERLLFEVLELVAELGADLRRVIVSHMCIAGYGRSARHNVARLGCVLGYDTFGKTEIVNIPNDGKLLNYPGDLERVKDMLDLIEAGFADQLAMAQDVAFAVELTRYGGPGYAHVLTSIVPLLASMGVTDTVLHQMLVATPARVLAFAPARGAGRSAASPLPAHLP